MAPRQAGLPQVIALTAVVVMPTLALASLVPDLPQLFQHFSTVPNHELLVPMIITVPSLCVALFSGIAGAIADRWGRRQLLIGALVAFSLLGLMPMMFDSLPAIIASRVIVGLAEATILTVGNALMGDYFDGAERQRWLGYQNMVGPFFGSATILAGGFLAEWHWRAPFLLYLVGFPVLVLVIYACFEPQRRSAGQSAGAATASKFPLRTTFWIAAVTIALSIVYFVQAVQHGRIFSDMGVASPSRISILVTAASMGTVVGSFLFSRLRLPVSRLLALGLFAYGVAYVGVYLAPNLWIGLPVDAMGQIGGGLILPTLIAWSLSKYDFEHRGRGMGIWGGCFFLGQFLSPPLMTFIGHTQRSFLAAIAVMGGCCLVAAVIVALLSRPAAIPTPTGT